MEVNTNTRVRIKEDVLSKGRCVPSLEVSLPFSPPTCVWLLPPVSSELLEARGSQSNERRRQRGSDVSVMSNQTEGSSGYESHFIVEGPRGPCGCLRSIVSPWRSPNQGSVSGSKSRAFFHWYLLPTSHQAVAMINYKPEAHAFSVLYPRK